MGADKPEQISSERPANANLAEVIGAARELGAALRVGHQVLAQKQGSETRFRATVSGWSEGRYIIAELPRNLTISGHVAGGDTVVMRYILRGVVYALACRVLQTFWEPSLAVLEWPRDLTALPLTNERRLSVQIPVTMETTLEELGDITLLATITDISSGGCQVEAVPTVGVDFPFQQGAKVRLRLSLDNKQAQRTINVEIRNAMVSAGKMVLGMSFVEGAALDLREMAGSFLDSDQ